MSVSESAEKCSVEELLAEATPEQRKWVMARLWTTTDREAAEKVGLHRNTPGRWPNKDELDRAILLMLEEPMEQARRMLEAALVEATQVKIGGLKSRNEQMRQEVASEIIDRVKGAVAQRIEHTGADGGPIEQRVEQVVVYLPDNGRGDREPDVAAGNGGGNDDTGD